MKKITFLIVASFVTLFSFAQITEANTSNNFNSKSSFASYPIIQDSNPNTFSSIADFISNDVVKKTGARYNFTCALTVVYENKGDFYITDGTSYLHGYDNGLKCAKGDILTGLTAMWNKAYQNMEKVTVASSVNTIYNTPILTKIDNSYINALVGFKKVLITISGSNAYPEFSIDGVSISIDSDYFEFDFTFIDGIYYDIAGIYGVEKDIETEEVCNVLYISEGSVTEPVSCGIVEMNGVEFNGSLILNPNHISIAVFTSNGKFVMQSTDIIDMTNQLQGIYFVLTPTGTIKISK